MQAEFMKKTIQQKGHPAHITGGFQQRNAKKQNNNIGQKQDHSSDPGNSPVRNNGSQFSMPQEIFGPVNECYKKSINPIHRNAADIKGQLEQPPHHKQKNRQSDDLVHQQGIYFIRQAEPVVLFKNNGFSHRTFRHSIFFIIKNVFQILCTIMQVQVLVGFVDDGQ